MNPNVPYKTRGNGAVAIRLSGLPDNLSDFKNRVKERLNQWLITNKHAQPGVAFVEGQIPKKLGDFYRKAMTDLIDIETALQVATQTNCDIYSIPRFSGRRGIIGALAAIGWAQIAKDYTFELVSYRIPNNWKRGKRQISQSSVIEMNHNCPRTFSNFDSINNEIKIAPHGPDPVLCGIRGESPEELNNAWRILEICEPISTIMLFRTNQGTGDHFQRKISVKDAKPYESVFLEGTILTRPKRERGGHTFFLLEDGTGNINCAAYEPTHQFRDTIELLSIGDQIIAFGGIRAATNIHPLTLNLEKVKIIFLSPRNRTINPQCSSCGKRLKSAGKKKGFQCKKCSRKYPDSKPRVISCLPPKKLQELNWIQPTECAWRHLTKPYTRLKIQQQWNANLLKINEWIKIKCLTLTISHNKRLNYE